MVLLVLQKKQQVFIYANFTHISVEVEFTQTSFARMLSFVSYLFNKYKVL
jgi:hypothetical protein